MTPNFNRTSPLQRAVFAAAAVFTMLATAASIEGLVQRYNAEAQLAGAQSRVLAQR